MSLILTSQEAEAGRRRMNEAYWKTPWGRKELKEKKKEVRK